MPYNYGRLGLAVADERSMVRGGSTDLVAITAQQVFGGS